MNFSQTWRARCVVQIGLIVYSLTLVNCKPIPVQAPSEAMVSPLSVPTPSAMDEAAIYCVIVKEIVNEVGSVITAYIVKTTNEKLGIPEVASSSPSKALDSFIQDEVSRCLADFSAKIVWVDGFGDVEQDTKTSRIVNREAIITLGNSKQGAPHQVYVPASIYQGSLLAQGCTFVVELQNNDEWKVTSGLGCWIT